MPAQEFTASPSSMQSEPAKVIPMPEALATFDAALEGERRSQYVIGHAVAQELFLRFSNEIREPFRQRVERGARALIRSVFTGWRNRAQAAGAEVLLYELLTEFGPNVAASFRSYSLPVRQQMVTRAFARAQAAHDAVLEAERPLYAGQMVQIMSAVAAEKEGASL